jgi:hypothetical protein
MKITEQQLRQIIREELVKEGIFDDISDKFSGAMGSVRSFFGAGGDSPARDPSVPLQLSDLVPITRGLSRSGLHQRDVLRAATTSEQKKTKTYPAAFRIGLTGTLDNIAYTHPFIVRGALLNQPALAKYTISGRPGPNEAALKLPEDRPITFKTELGNTIPVPKLTQNASATVIEGLLRRNGVDITMWRELTANTVTESQINHKAKMLLAACTACKALDEAFEILDNVYGKEALTLFRGSPD